MKVQTQTTVQINVAPVFSDATTAVCELHPRRNADEAYVSGGIVQLPPSGAPYEIEFYLEPPTTPLAFDRDDPWACKFGGCPSPGDHDPQFGHPRVDSSGKVLTVDSPPGPGKRALHYSLNFAGGARFDPIIVKG